jgi:hypothetical protein
MSTGMLSRTHADPKHQIHRLQGRPGPVAIRKTHRAEPPAICLHAILHLHNAGGGRLQQVHRLQPHRGVPDLPDRALTGLVPLFGADVAAGDIVMVSLLSANRDGSVFTDPIEFHIDRDPNPHLAFGHGSHFCIGAPLARLQAQVAIGQFLTRFPQARLAMAPDTEQWRPGLITRGLTSLPVTLQN